MLCTLCTTPSLADITTVAPDNASTYTDTIKSYFGDTTSLSKFNSNSGTMTLQGSALDEKNVKGSKSASRGSAYGRVFIIASEVKLNDSNIVGIKVCPVQIDAWVKKNPSADGDAGSGNICGGSDKRTVRFYQRIPGGDNSDKCLWLCANGYTGNSCEYEIDTNYNAKYSTDSVSYSLSVNTSGDDKDTSTNKGIHLGAQYFCSGDGYKYNDLAKRYLAATEMVSDGTGAKVQPVILSTSVGHANIIENTHSHLYYKLTGTAQIFCLAGYQPNSANTGCQKIPTNPCSGASTFRVPFTANGGNYVYNGALGCSYNSDTNTWCKMPNGGTTKCAAGYYGTPSIITISSTCGWNSSGCTACPSPGTSAEGATQKSECYRSAQSGTVCDAVGCYTESGMCYWQE